MAEQLKNYDFEARPGARLYPWKDWENGSIWKITRGEDFEIERDSMRTSLYVRARGLDGRSVRVSNHGDEDLVFQFYDSEE